MPVRGRLGSQFCLSLKICWSRCYGVIGDRVLADDGQGGRVAAVPNQPSECLVTPQH